MRDEEIGRVGTVTTPVPEFNPGVLHMQSAGPYAAQPWAGRGKRVKIGVTKTTANMVRKRAVENLDV